MATPIGSFQDILDALEQNPEYQEAMRRHILDEEIRRLPAEFRKLRETVDSLAQAVRDYMETTNERLGRVESDVAELKEGQARLESDVAELKEGQAELREGQTRLESDVAELKEGQAELRERQTRLESDVAELKEGQTELREGQARLESDVAELKEGQTELKAGHTRLEGRIGDVAGTNYERRIAKHCRSIVSRRLGIKRAKVLHSISVPDNEAFDDLVYAASEAGSITDEQAYDLDLSDIIVAGAGAPRQANYAVIEVSETIDDDDVDRAHERAAILARAISEPVVAAVIGRSVSETNRQRAARNDVTVIVMAEN